MQMLFILLSYLMVSLIKLVLKSPKMEVKLYNDCITLMGHQNFATIITLNTPFKNGSS